MGYSKNGTDITTLCEVAYGSGDTRNKPPSIHQTIGLAEHKSD
jgi:hypothetical protein